MVSGLCRREICRAICRGAVNISSAHGPCARMPGDSEAPRPLGSGCPYYDSVISIAASTGAAAAAHHRSHSVVVSHIG